MQFVAVEKNLASLGYFSPSNKKVKNQGVKTVTYTKLVDGKRLQAKATIVPGTTFGLPTTADQDKYIAFQKIAMDARKRHGEICNPVGFASAELLDLLGQCRNSGRNYEHVDEWLNAMTATTIISEGMVYLGDRHLWSKDRFRVFDRAISFGSEIDGGKRADKNYVWLSEWQLRNISKNYLLPIDFEKYLQLKNNISKVLVPHLQIWLFASKSAGIFEKRYDELCQLLNLRQYRHISKIREKLRESLDELVTHGYISSWNIAMASDNKSYKITFRHAVRSGCKTNTTSLVQIPQAYQIPPKNQTAGLSFIKELVNRDIPERQAKKLLANLADGQEVMDQLEWGDYWIRQNWGTKILNPTGFYIYLIRENIQPPKSFETSRKKAVTAKQEQARIEEIEKRAGVELEYENYRNQALDDYIAENFPGELFKTMVEKKRQELSPQYKRFALWQPEALMRFLKASVRADLEKGLSLQDFCSFCSKRDGLGIAF